MLKGGRGIVGGAIPLAVAAVAGLLGLNVQTYHRLTFERPVASIELHQQGRRSLSRPQPIARKARPMPSRCAVMSGVLKPGC